MRTGLVRQGKGSTFSAQWTVPDVYGIFSFNIEYHKRGYTSLSYREQVRTPPPPSRTAFACLLVFFYSFTRLIRTHTVRLVCACLVVVSMNHSFILSHDDDDGQVTVRPLRHNQYERFILSAYPYYVGAFSTMVGFALFSIIFLYHRDSK